MDNKPDNKANIYEEVAERAKLKYRPLYNLYMIQLYRNRIDCYTKFGHQPVAYYDCFDRI